MGEESQHVTYCTSNAARENSMSLNASPTAGLISAVQA